MASRLLFRAIAIACFLGGSFGLQTSAYARYREEPIVDTASLSRHEVTGAWRSKRNNRYVFRANGTYTFTAGNRASGNVSHSGTWRLANQGRLLRLHATSRVVLEGKRLRTLKANKNFAFVIATQDPASGFFLGDEEFNPAKR